MSGTTPREQKTPARFGDDASTEIDSDTELRAVAADREVGIGHFTTEGRVFHLPADGQGANCGARLQRIEPAGYLTDVGYGDRTACHNCLINIGVEHGGTSNTLDCPFCEAEDVFMRTHLPCDGVGGADDEPELVTDGGSVTRPYHDLNRTQRDTLQALARVDRADVAPSGQTVADEYARICGAELPPGRLYPSLDVLVEAGYVERGQIDGRTNSYELTPAGRAALEEQVWQLADATGAEVRMDARADGGQR